jgi:cytochrome P450 family 4
LDVINQRLEAKKKTSVSNENSNRNTDLLDILLGAEETADFQLTTKEIISDTLLFFLAGHETRFVAYDRKNLTFSASTLTSAFYFLAKFPEIQEKVYQEVVQVLGKDSSAPITPENLKNLKFTENVIKEVLRIQAPVPMVGNRIAVNDTEVGGYHIPKGVCLFL